MTEARTQSLSEVLDKDHRLLAELFRRVGSAEEARAVVLGELIRQLAAHLSIEQSFVLPAVRRHLADGRKVAAKLKADNREIQKLLVRIERRKPNSPDQPLLVDRLDEAFARHCLAFSSDVRPGLEAHLSGDEQTELRDKIVSAQGLIVSHPHPHLLSLGPVSRLTTRIAGRYDHIRDTVSGRRAALDQQGSPGRSAPGG